MATVRTSQQPVRRVIVVRRKKPSFWRLLPGKYKLVLPLLALVVLLVGLTIPKGPTTDVFVLGMPEKKPAGVGPKIQEGVPGKGLPGKKYIGKRRAATGVLRNGIRWRLTQPVIDNSTAFLAYYPEREYLGDLGDTAHQTASFPQDHTPFSASIYSGQRMKRGWIYAQDLGGKKFNTPLFARWFINELEKKKYEEVAYVITRHPANRRFGNRYFGTILLSPGRSVQRQHASGHESHVHISYRPGYEHKRSTIIADYVAWRAANPGAR